MHTMTMMRRAQASDDRAVRAYLARLTITPHPETGKVKAYVSQGRWVADCASCEGAEMVTEGRAMICGSCGAVRGVSWPSSGPAIETILARRPNPKNQNWRGETIRVLEEENEQHGLD